ERVVLQPVPHVGERRQVLAPFLEKADERRRRVLALPRETLALGADPVVVAARQQRATAQAQRPLETVSLLRRVAGLAGLLRVGERPAEQAHVHGRGGV